MFKFVERLITAACALLVIETAHAVGYIRGARETAGIYREKTESEDHE